jgi:exonuclease VII large subunit
LPARIPTRSLRGILHIAIPVAAAFFLFSSAVHAQRAKDPLTPSQEEQVRAVTDQPDERVKLFVKFIEQRTDAIHHAVLHPATQHPGVQIHDALNEFTSLVDELQDNLDAYDESHDDVRKSLKVLLEHATKWRTALREPSESPEYEFGRKTANDAVENLTRAASELLKSQEEYFSKHKPGKAAPKAPEG